MLIQILFLAPAVLGAPQFGYGYGGYGGYGGVYRPQYKPLGFGGLGESGIDYSEAGPPPPPPPQPASGSVEPYPISNLLPPAPEPKSLPPLPGGPPVIPPRPDPTGEANPEGFPMPGKGNLIPNPQSPYEGPFSDSKFNFKTCQVAWACESGI